MTTSTSPAATNSRSAVSSHVQSAEFGLDPRLCAATLPGLTVQLNGLPDGTVADVRAISCQDLVLAVPTESRLQPGDIVTFSVFENGEPLAEDESGVVHWMLTTDDVTLVAMFSVGALDNYLGHRIPDDRRGEIRYPINLPVSIRSGRQCLDARVVNYSLNGIGLLCREPLEINKSYLLTGSSGDSEIRLTLDAQWKTKSANGYVVGCALEHQHGVVLASRSGKTDAVIQQQIAAQIAQVEVPASDNLRQELINALSCSGWGFDSTSLWRVSTPVLAAFLIGMSIKSTGTMHQLTLISGLIGIVASLVFSVLGQCRREQLRKQLEDYCRADEAK